VRVAFLTQDLQLSGGVGVVVEYASRLALDHGFDVTLVHTQERREVEWRFAGLDSVTVIPLDAALSSRYDLAVATWWQTAASLFELSAERYVWFIQSLEERFYPPDSAERLAASLALDLPVHFITEARWIADSLETLRPGTRARYVRNGIAKDVFTPPPAVTPSVHAPLRILIEGSRQVAFKGIDDALAAASAMREPRHLTLVTPDASGVGAPGADRVLHGLSHAEMAELYADTDVVLKLSRVEGMFGPPLEGFHKGATCVVTPVTGHDEYVRHLENGLVVDWDDRMGTARALDLLARDRALLHHLRCGALATARGWPSWKQQATVMAAALRGIGDEPPPPQRALGRRLAHDLDGAVGQVEHAQVLRRLARAEVEEIRDLRAYRWGVAVRNFMLVFVGPPRAAARRALRRLRRSGD
jgi:glycosyltransferase involved in cell wall biosynthesis